MKKVLFVCKGNVGRSQMAQMFLKKMHPEYEVISAGFKVGAPGERIGDREAAANVISLMDEEGIDMRNNTRKQFNSDMCSGQDVIVTLVPESEIPEFLKRDSRLINWNIQDPYGEGPDQTRIVKDEIKKLIEETFV